MIQQAHLYFVLLLLLLSILKKKQNRDYKSKKSMKNLHFVRLRRLKLVYLKSSNRLHELFNTVVIISDFDLNTSSFGLKQCLIWPRN